MVIIKKILSLFPLAALIWVYNELFSAKPLRFVANKLIQLAIPKTIKIGDDSLILNQKDVGVSGMLALGVYEKFELELFRSTIKAGMTVVDIGANIGLYSVVAGKKAINGRVFSYEPEDENFSILSRNIKGNNLDNVSAFKVALSDIRGARSFYFTEDNRGTHSFADNRSTGQAITVKTDTLDGSLSEIVPFVTAVDVIKIDVEGAEPLVFEGMKNIISQSPHLIMFIEFYPKAIMRLGRSPIKFLETLRGFGLSISIINEDEKKLVPVGDFNDFINGFSKKTEAVKNLYVVKE
jgi:FkbM family methyltransferase